MGTNLTRDTTLTFDAGSNSGRVTQLFKGFHPMFIGFSEQQWYAVLYGGYYARSRELPGQDWGELEGPTVNGLSSSPRANGFQCQ